MSGFKSHFEESGGVDLTNTRTNITDETLDEIREIAARYPEPRSALLPALHLVQSVDGRVSPAGIEACADILGLTPAEVSGVATFYTQYKRKPVGKHHVGVCTTALCAVMGGDHILDTLQRHLGVGNDQTTADGAITLEHVECNAACDFAPVMMVNWEFFDNMTPQRAVQIVDDLAAGNVVVADRGATITSWREAERVLAGFPDGRANEGPSAGSESLLGLRIAEKNNWRAPAARSAGIRRAGESGPGARSAGEPSTPTTSGESK